MRLPTYSCLLLTFLALKGTLAQSPDSTSTATNLVVSPVADRRAAFSPPPIPPVEHWSSVFSTRWKELQKPDRLGEPPSNQPVTHARWLVTAGRKVVPGSVYRVGVQTLRVGADEIIKMMFRVSLTHDGTQVAAAKALLQPNDLSSILLKVPPSAKDGVWELMAEGHVGTGSSLVFSQHANLTYSAQFLTILIQPSRPVFNAGQTVRFRCILLSRNLKPYDEPVDVFVLDPNGKVMRRWPSVQTGHGVVTLTFTLPAYPILGQWRLRVRALNQIEDKSIVVEQYFKPRFEVFVRLPQTTKFSEDSLTGVVIANMTNWRHVYGNCSLKVEVCRHEQFTVPTAFEQVMEDFIPNFRGVHPFSIPLVSLLKTYAPDEDQDLSVRITAVVGDVFGWNIIEGFAVSRVVLERANLEFLGDQPLIFRPGMPITVHLFASYSDHHPFDEEELSEAVMTITFSSGGGGSKVESIEMYGGDITDGEGVVKVSFDVPDKADTLKVDASFTSTSGLIASASLVGVKYHSPRDYHLQIETSSEMINPGDYIVVHARNNFRASYINYLVVGNRNIVLYVDREPVVDQNIPSVSSFSIPASTEMAPVCRIVVWVVTEDGEVVSHSVAVPVNPLGRHEVDIRWNDHKDHSGGSSELKMLGEPGAFFGVSAIWEETNFMDAGHDLDEARVFHHMMGYGKDAEISRQAIQDARINVRRKDPHHRLKDDYDYAEFSPPHIRRAATRSRDGGGSTIRLFPTSFTGPDTASTFVFSDLVLLTDAGVFYQRNKVKDAPECEGDRLSCLTGGCYFPTERCNGEYQCSDRSDEAGCPVELDPYWEYRLHRINRLNRFYDPIDGDWAWLDVRQEGAEINVFPIPKRPQNWVLNMFSVGKNLGLGLLPEKIAFDSAGPFTLNIEAPKVARMWEQVGLRVCAFNFHQSQVAAFITLEKSDDYRIVIVEENGDTNSYKPKTTDKSFQHMLWLEPGEYRDVSIPIVFTRMGSIEVTIVGHTQMQTDGDTVTIDVITEGVSIGKHTSVLLDLKNRALVYEFLNIHLDESPLIPYTLERRFIYSTPMGHISVTGDVVGPAFPEIPVSSESMLGMEIMGAEAECYNFAANLWSLHYLRLTNQLTREVTYKVLDAVSVQYAAIARYQRDDGSFVMFPESEPSVWLTAHVLKTLLVASFQDWENYIYIDPKVTSKATHWLLQQHTQEGAFRETEHFEYPLSNEVNPKSHYSWRRHDYRNISLTAHSLLALVTVLPTLQSDLKSKTNNAITATTRYLARELPGLQDPYDLAVVTWALTKAKDSTSDLAFDKLDLIKRQDSSKVYWSREPVGFNPLIYEDNQRPFIQPKDDQKWDAHSVASTAYALLSYVERESLGVIHENIVRFLASMRELDGGLISTLDSAVALEALVAYSYRARIRDITNLDVNIEFSAAPNDSINCEVKNTGNLATMMSYDLSKIHGHVNIVGHGSGQALVQLDYSYSVDQPDLVDFPPVNAFDLEVKATYSGRNHSHINIQACQRWTNTMEAETSGLTITEVHLPSGYFVVQDQLIALVNKRNVPNLRWALRTDTFVKLFFNKLTTDWTCVSYELERWHSVSNLSRYNRAMVYSHYQPERFNMTIFETYALYDLDICEVCGSYQCPYCPFYSGASILTQHPLVALSSLLVWLILVVNFINH